MELIIVIAYLLAGYFAVVYALGDDIKGLSPVGLVFVVIVWLPVFLYGIMLGIKRGCMR